MSIGAIDFLMTELFEEFSSWNLEDVFLENLEPFILSEKLRWYTIQESILWKMIDFYLKKQDFDTLEKVILCLTFDSD